MSNLVCQINSARSFTCTVDSHSKFWTIDAIGADTVTRWGKIGTQGQVQRKLHAAEWQAEKFVNQKIAEKIIKGYVENKSAGICGLPADAKIIAPVPGFGQTTLMVCAGCFENLREKYIGPALKILELL